MHPNITSDAKNECRDNMRIKLQSAISARIVMIAHPIDHAAEFSRRLQLWLPEAQQVENLAGKLHELLPTLRATTHMLTIAASKTWCNGWPVGRRHGTSLEVNPVIGF